MDAQATTPFTSIQRCPAASEAMFRLLALIAPSGIGQFVVLLLVYDYSDLGFVVLVLAVLCIVALVPIWLAAFLVSIARRDWRTVAIGLASVASLFLVAKSAQTWSRQIHFWTMSPYYTYHVGRLTPGPDGRRAASFPIGEVRGFLTPSYRLSVEYAEGDDLRRLEEECHGRAKDECPVVVERLHGRYYFKRVEF